MWMNARSNNREPRRLAICGRCGTTICNTKACGNHCYIRDGRHVGSFFFVTLRSEFSWFPRKPSGYGMYAHKVIGNTLLAPGLHCAQVVMYKVLGNTHFPEMELRFYHQHSIQPLQPHCSLHQNSRSRHRVVLGIILASTSQRKSAILSQDIKWWG